LKSDYRLGLLKFQYILHWDEIRSCHTITSSAVVCLLHTSSSGIQLILMYTQWMLSMPQHNSSSYQLNTLGSTHTDRHTDRRDQRHCHLPAKPGVV